MNPQANDLRSVLAEMREAAGSFVFITSDHYRALDAAIANADHLAALLHGGGGEAVAATRVTSTDTPGSFAIISPALPKGTALYTTPPPQPRGDMVLVPREPTPEMLHAATVYQYGPGGQNYDHAGRWKAMLAAAPGEGSGE